MKEVGSQQLLPKKWLSGRRLLSEREKLFRDCLLLIAGGLVMGGIRLFGAYVPLAACLICAMPFGVRSFAAALGAEAGYFLFGGADAASYIALSLLLFSASAVFQGTELPLKRWFFPCLAAGVCGLLDGIGFLNGTNVMLWLEKLLLAGAGTWTFRSAFLKNTKARTALAAAVIAGLYGVYAPLGLCAAVGLCAATGKLEAAAAVGIALDLSGNGTPAVSTALLIPCLLCRLLPKGDKLLSALTYLVLGNLTPLLFGTACIENAVGFSIGVGFGMLAQRKAVQSLPLHTQTDTGQLALNQAAEVLELLCNRLPKEQNAAAVGEAESVYDGAAERVCRCCARFHRCWEHRAEQTCQALNAVAKRMIETGAVAASDFPAEFRENCCHLEGFATAVNQELEGMLFRRRYRMQLRESRQTVADELNCIAVYLRAAAQPVRIANEAAYLPMIGSCSIGKNKNRINGDRGASFPGPRLDHFVLLCDGMGTGREASACSAETVRLLERLLKSGIPPEQSLRLLNGTVLLSGEEAFTTVDLLHLHLDSGKAELYKWGSAPSFWRSGEVVKKIGTATTPPGAGVGGEHAPECHELSLKRGEMLVLASDGACGEETESALAAFRGQSPQELAALLISGMPAEDDMTAVAVSLRRCSSQ